MTRKTLLIAGAALGLAAVLDFAKAVQAGTCSPVTVKGQANNPAAATTQAQIKLTQKAAQLGGKVKQNSTSCKPIQGGFECTTKAVICP